MQVCQTLGAGGGSVVSQHGTILNREQARGLCIVTLDFRDVVMFE